MSSTVIIIMTSTSTQEFNKFTARNFAVRLKQANLVTERY